MPGIGAVARATPDAAALVSLHRTVTFGELDARQRVLAGALEEADVVLGDRVAVCAANRSELLEVTAGALRAGVVPVPVNRLLTPPEVAYILEDSGARWFFTDTPFELRPPLERVIVFGDAYERLLHEAEPAELSDVTLTRPMHYTSGTTGVPKGVWVPPKDEKKAVRMFDDFKEMWSLSSSDVHLVCSPLAHSAPHRFSLRTLEAGGTVALQTRFDAEETLAAIELFGATSAFMVPTHLERIVALEFRKLTRHDLSTMRLLAHAGAPIREQTKRAALELFPDGSVWEFYGSTEGHGTRISADEWVRKPGSVGTPRLGAEVRITDDRGRRLPAREAGEVWIHDLHTERFQYWRDRAKTKAAWREGGFTVGDVGYLDDDGYLFLTGRKDDTIITGGVNVYPQEVERVLLDHPAVADAMVYGVDDPEWGQQVRALVVPEYGMPLDADALRAWARDRLAGFKRPRVIEVADELPRTPTGKLKRS